MAADPRSYARRDPVPPGAGRVSVRAIAAAITAVLLPLTACQESRSTSGTEIASASRPLTEDEKRVTETLAASAPHAADRLTPAQRAAYGNRAGLFNWNPPFARPDIDWRTALSARFADQEPRWSQGFEELVIRDYFQDKKDGFFVDVGCFRPRVNSTTYFLERDLGWTGIGIDAMAKYAPAWKEHRPNAKFLARVVADKDGETVTFHVGKAVNSLDEEMVRDFGGEKKQIQRTTTTLDTILEEHGVEKVDFLSMDIEGAEPAALQGFDIQRYKPDLCCVEASSGDAVMEYFLAHGYELIEKYRKVDKINSYFRPAQPPSQ